VPVQDSIVCPDCGAAYQCSPEQQGKLLHCKCGRYLVAGGNNLKSVSVSKAAPSAKPADSEIGVKTVIPFPAKPVKAEPAKPIVREVTAPAASASTNSKGLMLGGAALALAAIAGLGFVFFRPSVQATTTKPAAAVASAQTVVATDPCAATPVRLENGTSLAHSRLGNGMGRLEIENTTPSDIAVRVTGSANLTVAWIYVQQGQKATIDNIPLGTHHVLVASGSDWDARTLTFKCNDVYAQFEAPLDYMDRREDDRTLYSSYKLVLGKQRTSMVSKSEFFKGHMGSGE